MSSILRMTNHSTSLNRSESELELLPRMEEEVTRVQHRSFKEWFQKYFMEGPAFRAGQVNALENLDPNAPWYTKMIVKHRRLLGVLIPFIFVQLIWLSCAIKYDFWELFPDRYYLFITMIFGSLIAGMTSLGGGVVAFPVMTLAFNITPSIARDFSLLIQSVGMSAASLTIFWMKIELEWCTIIFSSVGSTLGVILGLEFIDPYLNAPQKKIIFVSVWFSYAVALLLINCVRKRKIFKVIPNVKTWKTAVLVCTGILGGIFTAIAGTGVNICCFSVLTLLFSISEKTAMPTSVILMAVNSIVGFYWRDVMMQAIDMDSFYYFAVCSPVVSLGGPIGSVLGSHFHRRAVAGFICIINTVSLITSYAVLKLNPTLIGLSVGIIVLVFVIFCFLGYLGRRIVRDIPDERKPGKELGTTTRGEPETSAGLVNVSFVEENYFKNDNFVEELENDDEHIGRSFANIDNPTTTL